MPRWASLKGAPWWQTVMPPHLDDEGVAAHCEGARKLTEEQCERLVQGTSWSITATELATIMGMLRMNVLGIPSHRHCTGGLGIFDIACSFNHSCEPNAAIVAGGESFASATIRASRPIATGEEVTIDYLACFDGSATAKRTELREKYLFDCRCAACARDENMASWPACVAHPPTS